MGKKLYVGNLPYRTTDSDLHQLFSQAGVVDSAKVISDRETGRSKGFGFIEMANDGDADEAVLWKRGEDTGTSNATNGSTDVYV